MKINSIIIFTLFVFLFSANCASANCICDGRSSETNPDECGPCVTAGCKWNGKTTCDNGGGDNVSLSNPLGENATPQVLIGRVINAVLGVVGSLALLMFIYGGLVWMTASGNSEKVEKGKSILMWATIGLVVIFSSYSLINFILERGLGV